MRQLICLGVLLGIALLEIPPQVATSPPTAQVFSASAENQAEPNLHPKPPVPLSAEKLDGAIERGVAFLLKNQNRDGSWGSAGKTKQLNIIAEIGSHHGFRIAVTAMCVSALLEVGGDAKNVQEAIDRGEAVLFQELPKVRRDTPMLIYNVWTHAYGIQALVHMWRRFPNDKSRQQRIEQLIRDQYERLTRYESAQGGWGYYDFGAGTQRPNSSSTSFVNAAVLETFYEAKQIGVPPPEKLVRRAVEATQQQRKPDFTYAYDWDLRLEPMMPINRPGGSLGRSQACNLALRLWGDKLVTDQVLRTWLDRLITRNGWLDIGRKRPIPHESHFQVAGYFFYFGHFYATLCVLQLSPGDRPFYQDHLGNILIALQEQDGSWWDYPLYNYHQQWGTAFALMSLERCRKLPPVRTGT
jgi:hypothetical protein